MRGRNPVNFYVPLFWIASRIPFFSILVLFSLSSLAETPPLPPRKATSLKTIEQQIESEKKEKNDLEQQARTIERDMKGLKSDLISLAGKVQSHESDLYALEQRLSQLKKDKSSITNNLGKQKRSIADLVIALERIRRLPPETLVARPDAPLQTAQAATVLASILPELDRRSKKLRLDLDELDSIEHELTTKQEKLKDKTEKLKSDRLDLDKLMAAREKTLEKARQEAKDRENSIANLSRSAKDLSDLIARVEQKNRDLEKRTGGAAPPQDRGSPVSTAMVKAIGSARLPVSGIIRTRFGETDDIGATSKGITIEARPGSVVVAPVAGTVRYAGPFKKYGSIILLEHKNKFHSLVAGLGKIDTFDGQSVDAGEPLGRLPDNTGRLYYELRYRGDPVDPARQFGKLNK